MTDLETTADAVPTTGTLDALRPEHRALVLLADPAPAAEAVASAAELLRETFDWGVFLETAARQYVLPLVARTMAREGLIADAQDGVPTVPPAMAITLEHLYLANRRRNDALRAEVETIAWHAERAGLLLLLRKGLALSVSLYRDHGVRVMSDIDFLVRRADGRRAFDLLEGLGYVPGVPDRRGRAVDRWSKSGEQMMFFTAPTLPPLTRTTGALELPAVNVGLTTGLFERNAGHRYDIEGVIARRTTVIVGSAEVPCLDPVDALVDQCAHYFKDAKSLFAIEYGKDHTLLKLVDIRLLLADVTRRGRLADFEAAVESADLTDPIHFALAHVDAVFPSAVPHRLLADWSARDPLYLHRYGDNEGQPATWPDRSLAARIFDHTRARRAEGKSRFWGLTEGTADRAAFRA